MGASPSSSSAAPGAWSGQARLGLGWGEFVGISGDNAPHSHHAVQVILSEHPQPLWTAEAGWLDVRGAVIGPELPHQLGTHGEPVRLLYIEPHSHSGRRLMAAGRGLRVLGDEECAAALQALTRAASPDVALADALAPATTEGLPLKGDPDIEAWIAALPVALPDGLTAETCAQQLHLSRSRFLHRFSAHTGLPLRPYLRWRRLLLAMREVMQGHSLTEAAHAAGFADAAHFSRTFRRHFGLVPSALVGMAATT